MWQRVIVLSTVLLLCVACGGESGGGSDASSTGGSPAAAIDGMLALAKDGKWAEYVSTYYGEKHKMTKPAEQTQQIAKRLEGVAPKLIETLEACVGQEPTLSEDGTKATYPNGFVLHKDGDSWGFHL